LLLLLLRPGAGALFDGHRIISFRYSRRKTQTHPQILPVGFLLFQQQYSSKA
jgi:hypothetical protein